MPKAPGLPRASATTLSRHQLLDQLQQIDREKNRRERVLRLESSFRSKIMSHIGSLPASDALFDKFNTNPYVLLIHARQRGYSQISELESDILPAKQFSSMETSAGRMVEEVVFPEYGWECVASGMHTSNSALDGKKLENNQYNLVTLKSGPRCLNDEMSENFADAILSNYVAWAKEGGVTRISFTYGVLYGTRKQSNKKDWHILRNIEKKNKDFITSSPYNKWDCQFQRDGISVDINIRIGIEWWCHLGGELCFIEVFTALIRACVSVGPPDDESVAYTIRELDKIVSLSGIAESYNVSLLQRGQLPWLFLMARHFCEVLTD